MASYGLKKEVQSMIQNSIEQLVSNYKDKVGSKDIHDHMHEIDEQELKLAEDYGAAKEDSEPSRIENIFG